MAPTTTGFYEYSYDWGVRVNPSISPSPSPSPAYEEDTEYERDQIEDLRTCLKKEREKKNKKLTVKQYNKIAQQNKKRYAV